MELNYTTEDPTDDFDKTIVYQIEKTIIFLLNLNHDISGSALEANLSDTALDMELFYVQGMGSCLGKFTFQQFKTGLQMIPAILLLISFVDFLQKKTLFSIFQRN